MQIADQTLIHGRYRVVDLIGQGGMGAVYTALDTLTGSEVALKQLALGDDIGSSQQEGLQHAFEHEAALLAGLHHPNLPAVSDFFHDEQGAYLVMQYIPGDDLAHMMMARDEPFALADILRWADQLLDALDYLHRHEPQIVHRDIKPQNLKLLPSGAIVLIDFGLARGDAEPSRRAAPVMFGDTAHYAPFEQIRGRAASPRSDLYSLGATLFHLLAGEPPLSALERASAQDAGLPDPQIHLHELRPDLPSALCNLIMHMMAFEILRRPKSARAARAELHRAVESEAVFAYNRRFNTEPIAPPPPETSPLAAFFSSPWLAVALTAITIVAIALLLRGCGAAL